MRANHLLAVVAAVLLVLCCVPAADATVTMPAVDITAIEAVANWWGKAKHTAVNAKATVAHSAAAVKSSVTHAAEKSCGAAHAFSDAARASVERVVAAVPASCAETARDVLSGALSVVTVGQNMKPAAAGYGSGPMPIATRAGQAEAVGTHTTGKFLYSLGAAGMELLLIQVLYREPHGNRRRNHRTLAFFSSQTGFHVVAALLALPNGVAPLGVLVVLFFSLCDAIYIPLIVITNLLRPYLVAAIATCPCVATAKAATLRALAAAFVPIGGSALLAGGEGRAEQAAVGAAMETVLWFTVIGAIAFIVAARGMRSALGGPEAEDGDEEFVDSDYSHDDEEEDREVAAPAACKAAARQPKKKVPARSKTPSKRATKR